MIVIHQGRSSKKPYFLVADSFKNPRAKIDDQVLCIHPKTKEETKGIVITRWTFNWDINPLSGLILLEYGIKKEVLRAGLEALDPIFNDTDVSFLLIQEII
jgi:hypothetical protein